MSFVTVHLYETFTKDTQPNVRCNEHILSVEARIALAQEHQKDIKDQHTGQDDPFTYISPPFDNRLMSVLSAFETDPDCTAY